MDRSEVTRIKQDQRNVVNGIQNSWPIMVQEEGISEWNEERNGQL